MRRQGWALVDQELEEGLRAVAAPIHDREGRVVAAVNVDPQATRWTVEAIRSSVLPRLLEAAGEIDRELALDGDAPRRSLRTSPVEARSNQEPRADRGSDFVQSLERGLAVIRAFDGNTSLTLSEVATASGLTRAAARRFLLTLAELGYVRGGRARVSPEPTRARARAGIPLEPHGAGDRPAASAEPRR